MTELGSATASVADAGVRVPKQGQIADSGPGARPTWRDRVARLFTEDQAVLAVRRYWYWVVLAVVAGAAVSLGRVPSGPGVLDTIWAEDGSIFLTDAYNRNPFKVLLRPVNGYFMIGPRILTTPAAMVPVAWGPTVLTLEAALVSGLMAVAVYIASRSYLRHPLARLVAAVPVVAVPIGENFAAGTANNVATLQFSAVYVGLWMVLWLPKGQVARVVAALAVLAVSVSTILSALLLPLALLRLYGRRDRTTAAMVGGLLIGLIANVTVLALHITHRPPMVPSRFDPFWALGKVADWGLPHSLFGYGITGNNTQAVNPPWLMWVALGIVVLLVTLGAARLTRPQWKVATIMFMGAVAMLCATIMQYGGTEVRYVVGPELMFFASLVALVLPRPDRRRAVGAPRLDRRRAVAWVPLVAMAVGVTLVLGFSYRTPGPRTVLSSWRDSVAEATIVCADRSYAGVYIFPLHQGKVEGLVVGTSLRRSGPSGFPVLVPCDRLRSYAASSAGRPPTTDQDDSATASLRALNSGDHVLGNWVRCSELR